MWNINLPPTCTSQECSRAGDQNFQELSNHRHLYIQPRIPSITVGFFPPTSQYHTEPPKVVKTQSFLLHPNRNI